MTETSEVLENVFECARLAAEKRGSQLLVLNVGALTGFTDYFLLVTASSDRRVRTIAEAVRDGMKEKGVVALGIEGVKEGRWALVDFGAWVVHVFYEDLRGVFDLEGLWAEARRVALPESVTVAGATAREDGQ